MIKGEMQSHRIALVTGGSQGIGREIALRLADSVSGVAIHYFRQREAASKVVRKIRQKGRLGAAFQADLTKERQAAGLIQRVEEKFGGIDILVNNFGPILMKPWEKVKASEWEYIFQGNLMSALFCIKAVLPGMRERKWGRIINLGYSRAEQLVAFPTIVPYAISKTGLLILTRTVAASEVASCVTINMVSPGLMEGGVLPPAKNIQEKSLGKFKDVAEAVLFLASEEAASVTGTNLVVSGTWKM